MFGSCEINTYDLVAVNPPPLDCRIVTEDIGEVITQVATRFMGQVRVV